MFSWWRSTRESAGPAAQLYAAASGWAREPRLFADLAVSDTVDGRLAMLLLHVTLVTDRLGRIGPAGQKLAMGVTEAFVEHIDDTFRHVGVGDLAVPRKVKKAAAALYDAHKEYGPALVGDDDAVSAWRHALHLNLVSRGAAPNADIPGLADHALAMAARLKAVPDADLLSAKLS
jgi:cytochrome b pre-mRNA-processing protein 3